MDKPSIRSENSFKQNNADKRKYQFEIELK